MRFISLDSDKDNRWKVISDLAPCLSSAWVRRLRFGGNSPDNKRTGLDAVVRGVLVEPGYVCRDYRNLYSNFYSKKFAESSPFCTRLHFFSEANLDVKDICYDPEKHQNSYIGYSVIQPIAHHCIGRTVIDPRKCCFSMPIFCLRTEEEVTIRGAKYTVCGFPFISQSDEVMVCSHAALWSTTRYLSEKHNVYAELKPFDLIQMTGDSNGRRYPNRGMLSDDYSSILTKFGSHPIVLHPYIRDVKKGIPYEKATPDKETLLEISSYLESGLPVLASFSGHVINLVGHTLYPKHEVINVLNNSVQNGYGFYDSYDILRHYIVVDDNFFPYQKLGDVSEKNIEDNYALGAYANQLPKGLGKSTIYVAVIPVPEKVFMTSRAASGTAQRFFYNEMYRQYGDYCRQHNTTPSLDKNATVKYYLDKFLYNQSQDDDNSSTEYRLIVRPFLTSSKAFKVQKNLDFRRNGDTGSLFPTAVSLPHFVWVVEFTTAGLYNDEKVLGEVVLDATAYKSNSPILYARMLDRIILEGDVRKVSEKIFTLFRHNLGRR